MNWWQQLLPAAIPGVIVALVGELRSRADRSAERERQARAERVEDKRRHEEREHAATTKRTAEEREDALAKQATDAAGSDRRRQAFEVFGREAQTALSMVTAERKLLRNVVPLLKEQIALLSSALAAVRVVAVNESTSDSASHVLAELLEANGDVIRNQQDADLALRQAANSLDVYFKSITVEP